MKPTSVLAGLGLGLIAAVGVAADLRPYRGARWYEFRETAATLNALWDDLNGNILCPIASVGPPEKHVVAQGCIALRATPIHEQDFLSDAAAGSSSETADAVAQ